MSTELALVSDLMAMAVMPKEEVKRAMDRNFLLALVREHPRLQPIDFLNFIQKCQLTGADPRLNQIYLLVYNKWNSDKRDYEPKGDVVFAYQFFIQMAQRTGELEDFGVETIPELYIDMVTGNERKSITATAWVKRKNAGRYEYKARFWEFAKTDKKSGELLKNWKSSPYLMLEKCAIANVMRWAFPECLTGIYTNEEMNRDGQDIIDIPVIKEDGLKELPDAARFKKPNEESLKKLRKGIEKIEGKAPADVVTQPHVETPPQALKIETKIDFSGREIEDIRSELVSFLSTAPQALFERLKKPKEYLIEKVNDEKTLDGMIQKYSIVMKYI